jgi:hypothetical protein
MPTIHPLSRFRHPASTLLTSHPHSRRSYRLHHHRRCAAVLPRCCSYETVSISQHFIQGLQRHTTTRRRLHRNIPPACSGRLQGRRSPLAAQHASSRGASHSAAGEGVLLLAQDEQGHHGDSTQLHGLPARQSAQACPPGARAHRRPSPPLLTPPHRPGGAIAKVCRVYTPLHHHRPHHQVARSCSCFLNRRRRLRSRSVRRLGTAVWSSSSNNQRQGTSIHVSTLGRPLQTSGHHPHSYNCIPSAV